MKYLKNSLKITLIIIMLSVTFFVPSNNNVVHAQTLRSLKAELTKKEQELNESNNKKKYTQSQISNKRNRVNSINQEIVDIQNETVTLTEEIETLNGEIKEKEEEIKEIVNYYQISNSESAYLEYIFNATSFTDFIYRLAISEQLSSYNDKLVDEYNNKIKENEQKKKDLANKKVALGEKQNELKKELDSLGNQLGEIMDENVSIEDDIKSMKKIINTYENVYKCGLDEDVTTCGRGKLPAGTAFYRPVEKGRISANYGPYSPFGYTQMHYGVDIAQTGHGANVYAMADGKVAYITYKSSCGGNMVYIWHNVNGQAYTTGYFHLASVNVNVGDTVTTNTVIGGVGGNKSYETWDSCSTGTHLHIQISTTNIPQKIGFYTNFTARSFNPRNVLNLPPEGGWFYDRVSKY